jgi:hypothetical protein
MELGRLSDKATHARKSRATGRALALLCRASRLCLSRMSGRYGGSGVHGGAIVVNRYQHVPN